MKLQRASCLYILGSSTLLVYHGADLRQVLYAILCEMELVAWVHGVEATAMKPSRCMIILVMVFSGHFLQLRSLADLLTVLHLCLSPTSLKTGIPKLRNKSQWTGDTT